VSRRLRVREVKIKLKILQIGEPVLRQPARRLSAEEIRSPFIQQVVELMRETMRDAPGVGLAAPQIGLPLQLAVIEDPPERLRDISPEVLSERERSPVPFHVIINPTLSENQDASVEFFEGCLSLVGVAALVRRSRTVRVEYSNERGEPDIVNATGWYARILQHEIDHLNGTLYLDRMESRSLTTTENLTRYWSDKSIEEVRAALGICAPSS
jgi:peptide deformylase